MSLLAQVAEHAESKINPTGVRALVHAGRSQLDGLPEEQRESATAMLEVLNSRADDLAGVGRVAFVEITRRLDLGHDEDEIREWLDHVSTASADERQAALDDVGVAAVLAARQRIKDSAARWALAREIALEVLKVGGRIAISFLLGAL